MLENNNNLPSSVKSILNNPKLRGIENAIGNLIEVDEEYTQAITTSLGFSTNYVVVEDELRAKEAINYLTANKLGRVTFFPLNIIKGKYVDIETLNSLKKENGFIDIASSLVKYDNKYKNIIENQLGNVIVAKDIDSANKISKSINYKYKIVTLTGELLHVGGSITGGFKQTTRNAITDKYELENNLKLLDKIDNNISELENKMNEIDYDYKSIEDKVYLDNKSKLENNELLNIKNTSLKQLRDKLENITSEINSTDNLMKNNISSEEEKVLKDYYEATQNRNRIEQELKEEKNNRNNLNFEYNEFESNLRKENSLLYSKNKELKDLEIETNRMDVKLDNLLTKLNEDYSLTYEKAISLYKLDMEESLARNKVIR